MASGVGWGYCHPAPGEASLEVAGRVNQVSELYHYYDWRLRDAVGVSFRDIVQTYMIVAVYMAPWIVAYSSRARARHKIFVFNVMAGWTLVGWLVAAVWAQRASSANLPPGPARIATSGMTTPTSPPRRHDEPGAPRHPSRG